MKFAGLLLLFISFGQLSSAGDQTLPAICEMWLSKAGPPPGIRETPEETFERVSDFASLLQIEFRNRKTAMPPSLAVALGQGLTAQAKNYLDSVGVNYVVEPSRGTAENEACESLVITPSAASKLNRLAQTLSDSHQGLILEYNPCLLFSAGGVAAYIPVLHRFAAPSTFLVHPSVRNTPELHELRHSRNIGDQKRGIPSPYYGYIWAQAGKLPGDTDGVNYAEILSFDEMQTFFASLRHILIEAGLARKRHDLEAFEKKRDQFIRVLKDAREVVARTQAVIELLLQRSDGEKSPTFIKEKDLTTAIFNFQPDGSSFFVAEIPLINFLKSDSRAPDLDRLKNQMSWTMKIAKEHSLAIGEIEDLYSIEAWENDFDHLKKILIPVLKIKITEMASH